MFAHHAPSNETALKSSKSKKELVEIITLGMWPN
jgi:hypothetical protein